MLEPGVLAFSIAPTSMAYGLNPKLVHECITRYQRIYAVSNAVMSRRRVRREFDDKPCSRDNRHPVKTEPVTIADLMTVVESPSRGR